MMGLSDIIRCSLLVTVCLSPVAHDHLQRTSDQEPRRDGRFAVIIEGVGGEPVYTQRFRNWTHAMIDVLGGELAFAEDHIFYLTASPTETVTANTARATAAEVRSTFERLNTMVEAGDLIFVFLVGHGSFDGQQAKFNLSGPDLTAEDFDRLLDALPTDNVILVNAASASGAFIKPLSQPGRIVITATRSGYERNATRFAEFFIQAFKKEQADTDKNQRVSLLEAFTYATRMTAEWYERRGTLATEHALLDDNGDHVGHRGALEGDGLLARTTYLDARPLAQAVDDPILQRLLDERERLERAIEALKARKTDMSPTAYEAQLEKLLVRLARVNQSIKARQKR